MIAVQNLHRRYGARVAVRDLTFCARDGEITGLLGANGAGKTSTLRMIAGLLRPHEGAIEISGGAAALGALLDHTGLYARLTVRENIAYFGHLRQLPDVAHRVGELVARLGLGAIADRAAGGLSQGERMKAALGRALVHYPTNILLDEPTNGLDIPAARSLRELLRSMRDAGCCVVLSSHVVDDIRALCDRVVVIAQGAVVAEGTPEELCRRTGCDSIEEAYVRLTATEEVAA
jgi:sodium transport system ATP-binding protein